MTTVVFLGPSAPPSDVRACIPDAVVLPPVQRGDVYRASKGRPDAILVVDGYFDSVPSVWHKEILHALSEGIRVYGCSSMGAIRASELHPFGMVGIGAVFEEMAAGDLDDDDVIVSHGDASTGYRSLSTAMVNIRWTLRAAVDAGAIAPELAMSIDAIAKATFYPDRVLPLIAARAREELGDTDGLDAAFRWLHENPVDVKRADAQEAFRVVAAAPDASGSCVSFPRTAFFTELIATEEDRAVGDQHHRGHTIVDQLRLDPPRFTRVRQDASRRRAAVEVALASGARITQSMVNEASDAIRRRHGLLVPDDVERWLRARSMTWDDYAELIEREALARWGETRIGRWFDIDLFDLIRLDPDGPAIIRAAQDMTGILHDGGYDESGRGSRALDDAELLAWFRERHGTPDEAVELTELLGLESPSATIRLLRRAHAHETVAAQDAPDDRLVNGDGPPRA